MQKDDYVLENRMKNEALKRMEMLKLDVTVLADFRDMNIIYYSERQNKVFDGMLYWVNDEDGWLEMIKDFESEHNVIVYHAQVTHTEIGDMLSLLFVTSHEEDWASEDKELKDGYVFAYVKNLDDENCSEFGTIKVAPVNGGITRLQ